VSPRAPDPAALDVATVAARCADLDEIADHARGCVACVDLVANRTTVVAGDFPPGARLLLVGEAPGSQEDALGRPFIGKAGQLLDRLLDEVGLSRAGVAVANVLKCRPPANRAPTRAETTRCRGWLDRQVAVLDPPLVVTLGGTALGWALGHGVRLMDMRGRVHEWAGRRLIVTYHPSAAIRFGPAGAPMAALRDDLRLAAETLCTT
jgi:DNA polymerase